MDTFNVIKINPSLHRVNFLNENDINNYVKYYAQQTQTSWCVFKSFKSNRYVIRKIYICHHSGFNKVDKALNKKGKSKNSGCESKIDIKIKLTNSNTQKKDPYVKDGLPAIVKYYNEHNHSTCVAEALSFLRTTTDDNVKKQFEDYFNNGLGIAESSSMHESKLELEYGPNCKQLANASINPKYRTVRYWYDQWKQIHLGPSSGVGVIQKLRDKANDYGKAGIIVKCVENPFAVVIITPIMQRSHELPFSKDIVFVDSTSSCDAQGHSVTFMLTACGIGAVPLAIIITKNQTIADYTTAFNLVRTSIPNGFGNQGFPLQFITDDSDAERQALKSVFPKSQSLLCRFHVLQSVWRWLWESNHQIHKDDRKTLYLLFRVISEALTEELAMDSFNSAIGLISNSSNIINGINIPLKYPNWILYVSKYWDRKEIWCMAFRNASIHGHHTNNFSEVNVRLFKDIILSRNKAYNAVALVDFVCTSMEEYYQKRLRNFVNGRNDTARYLYEDQLKKASHIYSENIEELSDNIFKIKSENENVYYEIDATIGFCTCPKGKMGGFCKHQAAVYHHFGRAIPSLPPISVDDRYSLAKLAFGQNVGPKSFYEPFFPVLSTNQSLNQDINIGSPTIQDFEEPINSNNIQLANVTQNEEIDEYENKIISLMTDNFKKYHRETSSAVLQKTIDRLNKVKSSRTWESFLSTAGNNISLRHRTRATIRVQPTAISRRKPGITRGSKRLPVGRPLNSDKQKRLKRKRNLGENVKLNVPNAKSHN